MLFFRFNGQPNPVEWLEVSGSRNRQSGDLKITALGFEDEKFHLELSRLWHVGPIQNLTEKNLAYTNAHGFITDTLDAVQVVIIGIDNERIYGRFSVNFKNKRMKRIIEAEGEFSIHGQE